MELKKLLKDELDTRKFITIEKLEHFITPDAVEQSLHVKNPIQPGLADARKIASCAPKLFAILILLGEEDAIAEYLAQGFCDKDFPIWDKSLIPDVGRVETKHELFDKQWYVPIVLQQNQHLDLPLEFIPPIVHAENHIRHGSFGFVQKVHIAKGHLPQCNVVGFSTFKGVDVKRLMHFAVGQICLETDQEGRQKPVGPHDERG